MKKIANQLIMMLIAMAIVSCISEEVVVKETPPVDEDGNVYDTIRLGTQVWMSQNLKTSKYNDGTVIPSGLDNDTWKETTEGAFSTYNNTTRDSIYGKLYNWYAVNSGKLCPLGWHIPTKAEFETLINFLGGVDEAGGKMKSTGNSNDETGLWSSPNTGATNTSSFSGEPGGFKVIAGSIFNVGTMGYWWSSTEESATQATSYFLKHNSAESNTELNLKNNGFNCRCVKD
jgi:uncharacterized protein (TIGR02145 family)